MRMADSTPRTGTGVNRSGRSSDVTHNPAPSTSRGERRAARRAAAAAEAAAAEADANTEAFLTDPRNFS